MDENINQPNSEGYCTNGQLLFYCLISQKCEAFFLFSSNNFFPNSENLVMKKTYNLCVAVFAAAVFDAVFDLSRGVEMMDVVGFQPVDLVKSFLPPFLLASFASF